LCGAAIGYRALLAPVKKIVQCSTARHGGRAAMAAPKMPDTDDSAQLAQLLTSG
jgi:hypothetical protein